MNDEDGPTEVRSDGTPIYGPQLPTPDKGSRWAGPAFILMGCLVVMGILAASYSVIREDSAGPSAGTPTGELAGAESSPSTVLILPEWAEELTPRQLRYYEERGVALTQLARAGEFEAMEELIHRTAGLDGCETSVVGGGYEVGDAEKVASVAFVREEALSLADTSEWTVVSDVKLTIPPKVEPSYRGRYPNGEAYLKVIPMQGVIVQSVRCLVKEEA